MATAGEKLSLAQKHLEKVIQAVDAPDWADLSLYGFYALEAAVDSATLNLGQKVERQHSARVNVARSLHQDAGLPDVADLLRDLNEVRKSEAYGEVAAPELDAKETAAAIESYVEAVKDLLEESDES